MVPVLFLNKAVGPLCPHQHHQHPFLSLNQKPPYIHLILFSSPSFSLWGSRLQQFSLTAFIPSSFMGSFQTILAIFMIFMAYQGPLSLAYEPRQKVSTISAAPAFSPSVPLSSPVLSPDITPLFPSPGGMAIPPSDSSLPTIPSSRSPPNPEIMSAPGNDMALAPSGSLPASSSASPASSVPVISVLLVAMVAACIMQVPGM